MGEYPNEKMCTPSINWPPLPPGVYARRPRRELPFPLERDNCRLFSKARHGLWAALRTAGLEPGDEVLVPAFHHGSEIETLVQLGLVGRFYGGDESLAPDEAELESLLTPRVRALYLIHYNGFPQGATRWRHWADERGLLLVEDAAQAWLASSDGAAVGEAGDVSLFCLYKTFGLPDGAVVLARIPPAPVQRRSPLGAGTLVRRHASWAMERSAVLASAGRGLRRDQPYDPSLDFALGDPETPASAASRFLLPRIADPGAAARRRANYGALLREVRLRSPSCSRRTIARRSSGGSARTESAPIRSGSPFTRRRRPINSRTSPGGGHGRWRFRCTRS